MATGRDAPDTPLAGRRIILTRPKAQAELLARGLEALGAKVLTFPTIRIDPPGDLEPLAQACRMIGRYDWVVFTSVNGVDSFVRAFDATAGDRKVLHGLGVAAVGPATAAALARYGIDVDAVPDEHVGEAIVEAMTRRGQLAGKRVLLPRAEEAREALPTLLAAAGAAVDDVPAYRTVADRTFEADIRRSLASGTVDMVVFTSGSTARSFLEMAGDLMGGSAIASIGPVTSEVVAQMGHTVAVEADVYTAEGLLSAIRDYYSTSP